MSSDIRSQLRLHNPLTIRTTYNRPNLFFSVHLAHGIAQDFTRELVGDDKVSTIVYCPTRGECETIALHLQKIGINARAYHAALSTEVRAAVHADFIHDRVRVVVATVAFGMGIDHAETRKVINYGLVKNLESLVQMTGRAGRDGAEAKCSLFYSPKDYALLGFWKGSGNKFEKMKNDGSNGDGGGTSTQGGAVVAQTSAIATLHSTRVSIMFDTIKAYVNDSRCRRVMILEYFGQFCCSTYMRVLVVITSNYGITLNMFFVCVCVCVCVRVCFCVCDVFLGEDWRATALPPDRAIKGVVDSEGCCRHCDNCLMALAHKEAVSVARQPGAIMSYAQRHLQTQPVGKDIPPSHISAFCLAVHETGEKNGLTFLVQFCHGSKAENVTRRIAWGRVKNLASSVAYGSLKCESVKYLTALGRFLIHQGVLHQVYKGEFKIVHLGDNGKQVMKEHNMSVSASEDTARIAAGYQWPWTGGAEVLLSPELRQEVLEKRSKETQANMTCVSHIASVNRFAPTALYTTKKNLITASQFSSREPLEQQLFDSLVNLRFSLAKARGVPPYSLFSLPELESFASGRPTSLEALATFPGVSMAKTSIAGGGRDMVQLIATFCKDKGLETDIVMMPPQTDVKMGTHTRIAGRDNTVPYSSFLTRFRQHVERSAHIHNNMVMSEPCSWHSFTGGSITPVDVWRSSNAATEVKDKSGTRLKRYNVWDALLVDAVFVGSASSVADKSSSTKHPFNLEQIASTMELQVATLLGHCAGMIEEGVAYEWGRFNIPDAVVDAVQSAAVRAQVMAGVEVDDDLNNVGLWLGVPRLHYIKPLLPPEFDFAIIRLVLTHLKRIFGPTGPPQIVNTASCGHTSTAMDGDKVILLHKTITSGRGCTDRAESKPNTALALTSNFDKYKRKPTEGKVAVGLIQRTHENSLQKQCTLISASLKRSACNAELPTPPAERNGISATAEKRQCVAATNLQDTNIIEPPTIRKRSCFLGKV